MPLFMVKKENFDWIEIGRKHIEVRKGKTMKGDTATFLSGEWMLNGKIVRTEEGRLSDIINGSNFKDIIPAAENVEDVISYIAKKEIYGTREGIFTAYYFIVKGKKRKIIM